MEFLINFKFVMDQAVTENHKRIDNKTGFVHEIYHNFTIIMGI